MARVGIIVAGILLIATVLTVCLPEGKHWPNFSCHPVNVSAYQKKYTNHHGMGWESCKQSFLKYKGKCDKVCVLLSRDVLIRTVKNGPFTIDVNAFMVLLVDELGINMKKPNGPQKAIMDKVKSAIEECKIKHPEYATLTVKDTPCEPWENVTRCVDLATGCPDCPEKSNDTTTR